MNANNYVRGYHNSLARSLEGEYARFRWFSSAAARLDYYETRRAILRALRKRRFARALEVGCGDGVWTEFLAERADTIRAMDQSSEMLSRAQKRLAGFSNIIFENNDFLDSKPKLEYDLLASVRAIEYFADKKRAAANFAGFLKPEGRLVLITKNSRRVHKDIAEGSERLHTLEIDRRAAERLLEEAGFEIFSVYPAVIKWRPNIWVARILSETLQMICIAASSVFPIVDFFPSITESYVFIAAKNGKFRDKNQKNRRKK